MKTLTYSETKSFSRTLKKLTKRFRTLPQDLEIAKKAAIELLHIHDLDNRSCFRLKEFEHDECAIFKIKKFACRTLKGKGARSGIRVIYAYHYKNCEIVFIEIYYKESDSQRETVELIEEYLKSLTQNSKGN